MVAALWRRASLTAIAGTLLVVREGAAEPHQVVASLRSAESPSSTSEPRERGAHEPSERSAEPRQVAAEPSVPSVEPGRQPALAPSQLALAPSVLGIEPSAFTVGPNVLADFTLPPLKLGSPAPSASGPEKLGTVLSRVPTASWAMGCAAGIGLVVHALYQNTSDRRRMRMQNCAEDCPDYRIDHYRETRERADVALRLSAFAAASALWLAYNDPQEALERMGQRKLPREKRGFRVKVKPERRGVWASVVAYF